jgi:Mrp family chromosome partitioning ATPase
MNDMIDSGKLKELIPSCETLVSRLVSRRSLDRGFRHVIFIGPRVGTGTSTTEAVVAAALADRGRAEILVVDADTASPSQHELWNISAGPGLLDLTKEKHLPEGAVHSTTVRGVSVIPAGSGEPFLNWISSAHDIFKVVDSVSERFDFVLWDLPTTGDSQAAWFMGGFVDGIIFVVQAGKTPWEVAVHMKDSLAGHSDKFLGVVLNRKQFVIPEKIYKYL